MSAPFYQLHPISRLLIGLALLMQSMLHSQIWVSLLLIAVSSIAVRLIDSDWKRVVRSLLLLRWFMVPILILHMFFSPGELLFPEYPLPISHEGLMLGLQLSLHLAAIFLTAIVLFLCLKRTEWIRWLLFLPWPDRNAIRIYLMMMVPLKTAVTAQLQRLHQQWRLRQQWARLPLLLVAAVRTSQQIARAQTQAIWLRWPQQSEFQHDGANSEQSQGLMMNLVWAFAGVTGIILAWMV